VIDRSKRYHASIGPSTQTEDIPDERNDRRWVVSRAVSLLLAAPVPWRSAKADFTERNRWKPLLSEPTASPVVLYAFIAAFTNT
jgi:hypothetical protein